MRNFIKVHHAHDWQRKIFFSVSGKFTILGVLLCFLLISESKSYAQGDCQTYTWETDSKLEETYYICPNSSTYWNGDTYTAEGDYVANLKTAAGCDSIVMLHLRFYYHIPSLTERTTEAVVFTENLPYLWEGNEYTVSGNYEVTKTTSDGCDYPVYLHLTVADKPLIPLPDVLKTICPGGSLEWDGSTIYPTETNNEFTRIIEGVTENYSEKLIVSFYPVPTIEEATTTETVFTEDLPFRWNGEQFYTSQTNYTKVLQTANGCEYTATLNLTILDKPIIDLPDEHRTICPGATIDDWYGETLYPTETNHEFTHIINGTDADTRVKLIVDFYNAPSWEEETTIDSKYLPYIWYGEEYSTSGIYEKTLTTKDGCEYTETLHLIIVDNPEPCITASGTCGAEGDNLTWELSCDGMLTISGTGAMADFSSTSQPWNEKKDAIKSAAIENGVTTIGNKAFDGYVNLTSIDISETVTRIGECAFQDCNSLTSIEIPNSITSIGNLAFNGCGLTSVTIPNSITSIGIGAFSNCSSLITIIVEPDNPIYCSVDGVLFNVNKTTLFQYPAAKQSAYIIPNSVTGIGEYAFYSCSNLTSIEISNSVTSIGEAAFVACTGLTSITIPNNVTTIGAGAFSYCSSFTSITIPNSVISIGEWAFTACTGLTSVAIPNSITSIEEGVFNSCTNLTSIDIPNSITNIGENAFRDCTGLTSVTIPNSVTNIGNYAFYGCTDLTSITCEAVTPPTLGNTVFKQVDKSIPLYIPAQSIAKYQAADQWKEFTNILPIYSITLNVNDKTMGKVSGAGSYAEGSIVTITATPKRGYRFMQWSDGETASPRTIVLTQDTTLTAYFEQTICTLSVISSDPLKGIVSEVSGEYAYGTYVTITATPLEGYAFKGWNDQHSAFACQTYPLSRQYQVEEDAEIIANFGEIIEPITGTCGENLTWQLDCDGVLTISGQGTMNDWSREKETPWYNNDHSLGERDFLPIRSVVIEEGVTSVGSYAFRYCGTLISVSFPTTLTSIGSHAFQRTNISTLTIPANVETIEGGALYDCNYLTTITSYAINPPTNAGSSNFINSSQSVNIYIPCGTKASYSSHRVWKKGNLIEVAPEYSIENAIILLEPTCGNNSTVVFTAKDSSNYIFSQWSDGNTDNPRTEHLVVGNRFDVAAQYVAGIADTVCAGYEFIENEVTTIINTDMVVGEHHFFVYTANKPKLTVYPTFHLRKIDYTFAENSLRKQFAEINHIAPQIENIEWSYSVSADKTADTYIQSDELDTDMYSSVWVKYVANTSCGDSFSDTIQINRTEPFTTTGKDFWLALTLATYADQKRATTPFINISTNGPTTITITNPAFPDWQVTKEVNNEGSVMLTTTDIPLQYWHLSEAYTVASIAQQAGTTHPLGLHIEATQNVSIVASHYMETSMDATAVLPTSSLQSQYYTQDYPPYNHDDESYATFTILAVEDNTIVDITPTTTTLDGHETGITYSVSLNSGQVYYVLSQDQQSLSGTHVEARANKKIAVFQGNVLTAVPGGSQARDCLYEQAIPVNYWGTKYVVTRSLKKDANRVRVTASEDGTNLLINQYCRTLLNAGETYEFEMSIGDLSKHYGKLIYPLPDVMHENAVYIESSTPVVVYSYDVGRGYKAVETEMDEDEPKAGDPAMVWVAPLNMRMKNTTFSLCHSDRDRIKYHFLNIVASSANCQSTSLEAVYGNSMIDMTQSLEWQPVPDNPAYAFARVQIANESTPYNLYQLENSSGFIAHVYGHGDDESYAYNIGRHVIEETETVIIGNGEDENLEDIADDKPDIIVEPGGNLNINASGISIGVLIITADGVHSGQVHHGELPVSAEHIYLEYILNPWGTTANPNRWYAFAVPFEVDINGGITRTCDNKPLVSGTDFLIMKYDGWMRALQGKGWTKMESNETLVPGQFYMLGIDGTCNRWRFEKKAGRPYEGDAHDIQLSAFDSPNTANAGWNSLGNTLLEYAGLSNMSLSGINYMVTYDNQFGKYATKLISEMKDLFVGQPFFIQTTGDGSFDLHHYGPSHMPALYATQAATPMMHFSLTDETQSTGIDHMYLTMHEDADGTYTIGRDVARMTKDCKTAAQLWCSLSNGTELSAHGISMPETETVVPVILFAPTKGEYLLNMSSRAMIDYQVELLFQDTYLATLFEGQPVTLDLNAGTNSGYTLRITRRNMPTGVEAVQGNKEQSTKVLIDNHLYILRGEHVYDAQGKQVK